MQEERIRDVSDRILGIIRTEDNGDRVAIEYPSMRVLGRYRKALDETQDLFGRVLSRGDTVINLLFRK